MNNSLNNEITIVGLGTTLTFEVMIVEKIF